MDAADEQPGGGPSDGAAVTVKRSRDPSGAVLLTIGGEIDMASVPALQTELQRVLATHPGSLVFDMSAVRFMDSSGIAALLRCVGQVADLRVRNPSRAVRRIIEASGSAPALPMTP